MGWDFPALAPRCQREAEENWNLKGGKLTMLVLLSWRGWSLTCGAPSTPTPPAPTHTDKEISLAADCRPTNVLILTDSPRQLWIHTYKWHFWGVCWIKQHPDPDLTEQPISRIRRGVSDMGYSVPLCPFAEGRWNRTRITSTVGFCTVPGQVPISDLSIGIKLCEVLLLLFPLHN